MDARQTEISRHALGLDGLRTHSYRNRYTCGRDTSDHALWLGLVQDGDAEQVGKEASGNVHFRLTFQGARKVLLPAETLDGEDFPNDGLD